ncbi:Dihydroorotate oxidase B, electron transfer subunit [Desulfovibrionales bacterium]
MLKPVCCDVSLVELIPLGQTQAAAQTFLLTLESPGWTDWRPGQFVMLRPAAFGRELTWARPFSICAADEGRLTILFKRSGRGTDRLVGLTPGAQITVWGPLGNGFPRVDELGRPELLLAGGIGLAPFVGYGETHPAPERILLLFGHRLPLTAYPFQRIAARCNAQAYHEQSMEDLVRFINLVRKHMVVQIGRGSVLACGPLPFLRLVQASALEYGVTAYISLENSMACGIGACLGCVQPNTTGWPVQVCTKGPVFRADALAPL